MNDRATIAWYRHHATAATFGSARGPHRHLDPFLGRLAPGAAILELGCGGGVDSARMIARGFAVTPTDGVPRMAALAAARLGRPVDTLDFATLAAWSREGAPGASDLPELRAPLPASLPTPHPTPHPTKPDKAETPGDTPLTGTYDAVWAHACLLHVPRADLPAILHAIRRLLRPGGWHFANYKLGAGEGRDLLGRLHNFPDPAWLKECYRAAGFAIVASERYSGEGRDGTPRDWLALTVQPSATPPPQ